MATQDNEKDFAVVSFIEEKPPTYGVVPVIWTVDKVKCFYPDPKLVSEQKKNLLVKAQASPTDKWTLYQIKILKYYSTYEAAIEFMDQAEYTSNLESECEVREEEPKRRKRQKKNIFPGEEEFYKEIDDDSESEDGHTFIRKPTGGKSTGCVPTFPTPPRQIQSTFQSPSPSYQPMKSPSTVKSRLVTSSSPSELFQHTREEYGDERSLQTREACTRPNRLLSPFSLNRPSTSHYLFSKNSESPQRERGNSEFMWQAIEQLQETVLQLDSKMDNVLSLLQSIVNNNSNTGSNNCGQEVAVATFSRLPAATQEDFGTIDNQLKDDPSFKQRLIKLLTSMAGRDARATTAATLRKMITDDVAEQYSLTGKPHPGAPQKRPFTRTEAYKVIFEVCVKSHKDCKDKEIRQGVSDWLMQAKFRKGRRDKKTIDEVPEEVEEGLHEV